MKKKLKEIFDIATGGTPSRSVPEYWKNGTIPWVKIGNINSKYVDSCDEYITEKGLNDSSAKLFKKGTILYTIFATLGEVAVLNFDATTNQAIAGLSIKNDGNDINYLYYALKSLKDSVLKKGRGVAQNNINMKILKELEIPLPPFFDQIKIAAELDTIQSAIDNKKQQLALLDEAVKSEFVEMFGENPVESGKWKVENVGTLSTEVKYGTSSPAVENGRYKYLRMNNITATGYLDLNELKYIDISDDEYEKCVVRKGDIIFNRTNSREHVGKTCLYDLDEEMIIAGYLIRVRLNNLMNPRFFSEFMNIPYMKLVLRKTARGAVNQSNINSQELKKLKIPVPPLDLQNNFASFVQQIDKSKSLVKQQIADLQELLDSKMQEYFA